MCCSLDGNAIEPTLFQQIQATIDHNLKAAEETPTEAPTAGMKRSSSAAEMAGKKLRAA